MFPWLSVAVPPELLQCQGSDCWCNRGILNSPSTLYSPQTATAVSEQELKKGQDKKFLDSNKSKQGKLPLGEVHPQFIKSLGAVLQVSKEKGYKVNNWLDPETKCYFVEYLTSAAIRHIDEFLEGKDWNYEKKIDGTDIEAKVLHVECAAYNLLMIATLFRKDRTDLDDRYKEDKK